ncbi:2OG-Fe dioxygenase family protein [Pectobacteriaceae bacterium CE90]|nr:2OG-Fe dioxygenase family protein [Pectobacteriaceae bacterium CE90]
MELIDEFYALPLNLINTTANEIKKQGWAFIAGQDVIDDLELDYDYVSSFGCYWDSLVRDEFMADNGTYRYRRYSHFRLEDPHGKLILLPHEPYSQSTEFNYLNGGVERYYPPLETSFINHPLFISLIRGLAQIFNCAEKETRTWTIRLHPYRILTNKIETGKPTPEGLHRDGVDYIAMALIRRVNVSGGVTTITDSQRTPLHSKTLNQPMDIIVADDRRIMHEVSPISCSQGSQGYRDVLVIAFERDCPC